MFIFQGTTKQMEVREDATRETELTQRSRLASPPPRHKHSCGGASLCVPFPRPFPFHFVDMSRLCPCHVKKNTTRICSNKASRPRNFLFRFTAWCASWRIAGLAAGVSISRNWWPKGPLEGPLQGIVWTWTIFNMKAGFRFCFLGLCFLFLFLFSFLFFKKAMKVVSFCLMTACLPFSGSGFLSIRIRPLLRQPGKKSSRATESRVQRLPNLSWVDQRFDCFQRYGAPLNTNHYPLNP